MPRYHIVCRDCDAENVFEDATERHVAELQEMHEEMHPDHTVVYAEMEVKR
jgi:hypothetical protein